MEDVKYFLIKPKGRHKSFGFIAYKTLDTGKREYQKLPESLQLQVTQINSQLTTEVITTSEALVLFKDLILKQYKKHQVKDMVLRQSVISTVNQKIFNQFWDKEYSIRHLSDEMSPRYDILKAIRLVEPLALSTATAQEFQAALKKNVRNTAEMRRGIDRLNQILRFLGRDFKLHKPAEDLRTIQYLSLPDFRKVLQSITDPIFQDFAVTLFATGMRLSESLAVTEADYRGGYLQVNKQLTPKGVTKLPKRGKVGRVAVLSFGREAVQRWVATENKAQYRERILDVLAEACKKTFPTNRAKWVSPHDLRHSHAIYLLSKGATLKQVALNLRNKEDVCEKYYVGYSHTDETIEGLKRLLD